MICALRIATVYWRYEADSRSPLLQNARVRVYDHLRGRVSTLAGNGSTGYRDGPWSS